MTRDTLRRLGVPDDALDTVLDGWSRELAREAVRLAAATLKDTVDNMPQETRTAINATLTALTPELAARRARVSRRTICRAINSGAILAVKGSTGLVILDRDSFAAWARARVPPVPALPALSQH